MSEPAKDEASLFKQVGEEIRKSFIQPGCCMEYTGCQIGPCFCSQEAGKATLAAIRAAGWAVVPVEPTSAMKRAGSTAMVKLAHFPSHGEVESIYRSMIAAALEVKP